MYVVEEHAHTLKKALVNRYMGMRKKWHDHEIERIGEEKKADLWRTFARLLGVELPYWASERSFQGPPPWCVTEEEGIEDTYQALRDLVTKGINMIRAMQGPRQPAGSKRMELGDFGTLGSIPPC